MIISMLVIMVVLNVVLAVVVLAMMMRAPGLFFFVSRKSFSENEWK